MTKPGCGHTQVPQTPKLLFIQMDLWTPRSYAKWREVFRTLQEENLRGCLLINILEPGWYGEELSYDCFVMSFRVDLENLRLVDSFIKIKPGKLYKKSFHRYSLLPCIYCVMFGLPVVSQWPNDCTWEKTEIFDQASLHGGIWWFIIIHGKTVPVPRWEMSIEVVLFAFALFHLKNGEMGESGKLPVNLRDYAS